MTYCPPSTLPWLGGSSMLALEILSEFGKLCQRDPQRSRDAPHVAPRRIDPARLDVRDPGRVNASFEPQRFLAQLPLLAKASNSLRQPYLTVFLARHLEQGMCLPPPRP